MLLKINAYLPEYNFYEAELVDKTKVAFDPFVNDALDLPLTQKEYFIGPKEEQLIGKLFKFTDFDLLTWDDGKYNYLIVPYRGYIREFKIGYEYDTTFPIMDGLENMQAIFFNPQTENSYDHVSYWYKDQLVAEIWKNKEFQYLHMQN